MSPQNSRAAGTTGPEVTLVEEVPMIPQERGKELRRLWQQERVPVAQVASPDSRLPSAVDGLVELQTSNC
jgi:hypothetical protein